MMILSQCSLPYTKRCKLIIIFQVGMIAVKRLMIKPGLVVHCGVAMVSQSMALWRASCYLYTCRSILRLYISKQVSLLLGDLDGAILL